MTPLDYLVVLLIACLGIVSAQPPTESIRAISEQIWANDINRINETSDLQYNVNGPVLFTYVNEEKFTASYHRFIALLDNYNPQVGVAEVCDAACEQERNAFLDSIIGSPPIVLVQNYLFFNGLAAQTLNGFKEELRQYFFMDYTRSGGPLDSSGFEQVFLGEIMGGSVLGLQNWIRAYKLEQEGNYQYGFYFGSCPNEIVASSFDYLGVTKPFSAMFIRTSPEVEIALYTLCLLTRPGTDCPVRFRGIDQSLTVMDMEGLPKTVAFANPNC